VSLPEGEEAFKLAAKKWISNSTIDIFDPKAPTLKDYSLKYQVLSQFTAFVGIVKQEGKSEEEMERIRIPIV